MLYRLLGRLHGLAYDLARSQRGQGTVEYVGLVLIVAVVLAGVVAATKGLGHGGIPQTIMQHIKDALGKVK